MATSTICELNTTPLASGEQRSSTGAPPPPLLLWSLG
jgi:hypothetical protein